MIKLRWYQSKNPNVPPVLQYKVWLGGSNCVHDSLTGFGGKWSIWMPVEAFYAE
jgi:hypothetical protein